MIKHRIEYSSPLDALVAISKRLSRFEAAQGLSSEEFFHRYTQGRMGDEASAVEWANDYRHYLALRADLEQSMPHDRLSAYLERVGPAAEFPQRRCGSQHPIRYPERAMPGVNI